MKKILNDKVVVGHSLKEDFEHLKLNKDEYACEIRDISEISFFKRRKNDVNVGGNVSPVQLGTQDSFGSSASHHSSTHQYNPFNCEKRKLKELADEFLNAKIQ